jgi:16S rRNA G966 N2-methylase RsmD
MIVRGDFVRTAGRFDLVWLDPPYETPDLAVIVERAAVLVEPAGLVVVEHSRRRSPPPVVPGLARTRELVAGDSALSFYAPPQV